MWILTTHCHIHTSPTLVFLLSHSDYVLILRVCFFKIYVLKVSHTFSNPDLTYPSRTALIFTCTTTSTNSAHPKGDDTACYVWSGHVNIAETVGFCYDYFKTTGKKTGQRSVWNVMTMTPCSLVEMYQCCEEPTASITEQADSTFLRSVGAHPHVVMWRNTETKLFSNVKHPFSGDNFWVAGSRQSIQKLEKLSLKIIVL